MSQLQEVCDALVAVNGHVLGMAQELHGKAQAYRRAAASAATSARSVEGASAASLLHTANAFSNAARHCSHAAQELLSAAREGQSYVEWAVGSGAARHTPEPSAAQDTSTGVTKSQIDARSTDNRIDLADDVTDVILVPDFGGYLDVVLHGNAQETEAAIRVHGRDVRVPVTKAEIIDMVRSHPSWNERPIRLLSCSVGQANYAQELADVLGVAVYAPSDVLSVAEGVKTVLHDGEWRRFEPRP